MLKMAYAILYSCQAYQNLCINCRKFQNLGRYLPEMALGLFAGMVQIPEIPPAYCRKSGSLFAEFNICISQAGRCPNPS